VDKVNKEGLDKIEGETRTYKIFTKGKVSSDSIKNALARMDDSAQYEKELVLKVGAQVMLIANVNQELGLVNGRLGIVTEMNTAWVMVRFKCGYETKIDTHEWKLEDNEHISRCQIPLILAYAITIHKCQGSTLDSAFIDIGSSIFEYGQAYVALSRVKSIDALYLHSYSRKVIKAHPKVVQYYESLYE
jgi:ATP-dependent DNA helicase PIF1